MRERSQSTSFVQIPSIHTASLKNARILLLVETSVERHGEPIIALADSPMSPACSERVLVLLALRALPRNPSGDMCDIKPYKNQDYEALKSAHNSTKLFVDPEFPATSKSIYHSGKVLSDVQWYRPTVRRMASASHSSRVCVCRKSFRSLNL